MWGQQPKPHPCSRPSWSTRSTSPIHSLNNMQGPPSTLPFNPYRRLSTSQVNSPTDPFQTSGFQPRSSEMYFSAVRPVSEMSINSNRFNTIPEANDESSNEQNPRQISPNPIQKTRKSRLSCHLLLLLLGICISIWILFFRTD